MNMSAEEYQQYVQQSQPKSPIVKDTVLAFLVGGLIVCCGIVAAVLTGKKKV